MKVPTPRKLKSGSWFVQLRMGGKSVPITASSERECIRQAQLYKAEYRAGKRVPAADKLPTLGEAIDAYIRKRDAVLSPSTIRGYRIIRRNRFVDLMDRSLSDIRESDWQSACNAEAKLCSAKTLKNAWGFIASVIDDAGGKAPDVTLPQVIPKERPFLEPEQIAPFIAAVHGTPAEIPALLALSSLRRSEILALRWDNVDLKKRVIRVQGAAVLDENEKLVVKAENKNATSARTVPIMVPELYDALKEQAQSEGFVTSRYPSKIYKQVNLICRKNGLPEVGVHGLRHSFVSLCYHLGIPEKVVMEIGGWADYQTMRKIYTHIARSDVTRYTSQITDFFTQNANKNAN